MHPTLFRIPFLPEWLADVKSYGVMMMIAFLSGIWMACRRAEKVRANPDVILNLGFIALVTGIVGARAMYVIHYWDTRFGNQPFPLMAALDIRAGGLEFLGGPILTIPSIIIYLKYIAKVSTRWYVDISMPSLMWGLAITRVGCFLNGCCWGAVCVDPNDPHHEKPAIPWAIRFPYGSGPVVQQFKFGQLTLPKELLIVTQLGEVYPVPAETLEKATAPKTEKKRAELEERLRAAQNDLLKARESKADAATIDRARAAEQAARSALIDFEKDFEAVRMQCAKYGLTPRQLADLAANYESKPVHPAQLYAVVNGFLLSAVLSACFWYRKRHGVLLGVFLLLYPISRFLEELIRQDNPLDFGGLTISQFLGLLLIPVGALYLWWLYRQPEKCPRAVAFIPPPDPEPGKPKNR